MSRSSSQTPKVEGKEVRRRRRTPRQDNQVPKHWDKSSTQKIRDLDTQIDTINTSTRAPITVNALVRLTEPPFIDRIMRTRVSSKFKLQSQLGIYEGKTNPMDHLDSYMNLMILQGYSDEVMCKAFSATLKGSTRTWFRKLSLENNDSFSDLNRLFIDNFMSCRVKQKKVSHLFTIH